MQHLQEILDLNASALEWMMKEFPEIKERDEMRKIIGRYGLSGQQQVTIAILAIHMLLPLSAFVRTNVCIDTL